MRYLIDSNIWIYAAAGVDCVIQFMNSADLDEWIGYSSISRLEVMGYKDFDEGQEGKMKRMMSCFNECEISASIVDRAIVLRKQRAMKAPDAIIAATALENKAVLVTRNASDFRGIVGLQVIDPFEQPLNPSADGNR